MIRYTLICDGEHSFESWFRGSDSYDEQVKASLVACPHCGSAAVRKALMAPSVQTSRRKAQAPAAPAPASPAPVETPTAGVAPDAAPATPVTLTDPRHQALRAMVRELHHQLTKDAHNVGRNFAAEARAIHDNEAPARSIYGEASREEVRALLDDGIPLLPLPSLPDEKH